MKSPARSKATFTAESGLKESLRKTLRAGVALTLGAGFLVGVPTTASAAVDPSAQVVINEVYGGGGNSGATYKQDFVELYNKGAASVDLSGWSIQYGSAAGSVPTVGQNVALTPLTGTIEPGGYFLIGQATGTGGTVDIAPDVTGTIAMSSTNAKIALVSDSTQLNCESGCGEVASVVDFVGTGTANDFAGAAAPAMSNSASVSRTDSVNTANNGADFTAGAPTPTASGAVPAEPQEPGDPTVLTIAQIQGTGPASPVVDTLVTTSGVVTAAYPTGGYFGYVLQVPGEPDTESDASQAIYIYQPATTPPTDLPVEIGQTVQVTGTVREFNTLTEIEVAAVDVEVLADAEAVTPLLTGWPTTVEGRESLESMLIEPDGDFTITNTYSTNRYGELGLAFGDTPLLQPTDRYPAGSQAATDLEAENAGRAVTLDDGSSADFLPGPLPPPLIPPYISLDDPVRVGAGIYFDQPVIVDYRVGTWRLQPTSPVTYDNAAEFVSFENTRTDAPSQTALGGDFKVASFNVLNYFTTLGSTVAGCTFYADRTGDGVTVNRCPSDNGPRGAWDPEDLQRQQAKIVAAINELDASVVGLMEIENSAVVDGVADEAVGALVAALNEDADGDKWAFVPSSTELPGVAEMDVISNAIIYQPELLTPLGESRALGTQSAVGQAFENAREPIGQAFIPAAGGEPFFFAVNHFKSKSAGGAPNAPDPNANGQQGAWNGDRIAQASALNSWINDTVLPSYSEAAAPVTDAFLVGDFNSYTQEDSMQVLYTAGYENLGPVDEYTYSYSGLSGSLDHVLANAAAADRVSDAQVWNINAPESLALEYSRYNYQGATYYNESPFRSSDHDPVVAGVQNGDAAPGTVNINLLNINDFHGRIDANTVQFAGTIEELRAAEGEDSSLFLSAGDNIGASLFASSSADDQPTIDVLNALDLAASAVGNHEFDQGFDDLTDRVVGDPANAAWDYLGANVYEKGTTTTALPEYAIFTVSGLEVAVIGAVTQETPTLVSLGGIAELDFGNPVEAVNRVAAQLSDGNPANGEADVVIAEFHEGAGAGIPDGSTLEEEVALTDSVLAEIITTTSADVDAIFNGHTHKQYAWDAPIPGVAGKTRPVLQTGSYGEFIGQIVLTVQEGTGDVVSYTKGNIARSTATDEELIQEYPRVAQVDDIVDAALAAADIVGAVPVGSVTADITTAYSGGSYVDGVYTGSGPLPSTGRDDRSKESALGNLVANSLVDSLSEPARGGATIGVVNPGGLRNELYYDQDGVITYAEANAVLPFVNNLWTVTLSGDQFKTLLEQQWQTAELPSEPAPSRPYLQLGVSDNVSYTYDDAAAAGSRITSITVDGVPIDPAGSYRIGTFSFLAEGGDNFRIFRDGADVKDSGLIDRDAWIQYLTDNPDLSPNFARRAVGVWGVDTNPAAGETMTFTVSGLDLTSLGAPENSGLTISLASGEGAPLRSLPFSVKAPVDADLGTAIVSDGAATVTVAIPASASGLHRLVLVAGPSGTTVTLPLLDIEAVAPPTTSTSTPPTSTPPTDPSPTDPSGSESSSPTAPTSTSASPTGSNPTVPGGKGTLSNTGVSASLMPLAMYAVLLLVIGAGFLLGAQRRTSSGWAAADRDQSRRRGRRH